MASTLAERVGTSPRIWGAPTEVRNGDIPKDLFRAGAEKGLNFYTGSQPAREFFLLTDQFARCARVSVEDAIDSYNQPGDTVGACKQVFNATLEALTIEKLKQGERVLDLNKLRPLGVDGFRRFWDLGLVSMRHAYMDGYYTVVGPATDLPRGRHYLSIFECCKEFGFDYLEYFDSKAEFMGSLDTVLRTVGCEPMYAFMCEKDAAHTSPTNLLFRIVGDFARVANFTKDPRFTSYGDREGNMFKALDYSQLQVIAEELGFILSDESNLEFWRTARFGPGSNRERELETLASYRTELVKYWKKVHFSLQGVDPLRFASLIGS